MTVSDEKYCDNLSIASTLEQEMLSNVSKQREGKPGPKGAGAKRIAITMSPIQAYELKLFKAAQPAGFKYARWAVDQIRNALAKDGAFEVFESYQLFPESYPQLKVSEVPNRSEKPGMKVVQLTVDPLTHDVVKFWAKHQGVLISEYIRNALFEGVGKQKNDE